MSPAALAQRRVASAAAAEANAATSRAARELARTTIENVEFMLTHRESMHMAACRMGLKPDTLERRLGRYGRYDLVSALKANQYETTTNPNKDW